MMLLAVLISFASVIGGLYVSYYFNVSTGAAIVLGCSVCFVLAWATHTVREALAARTDSRQPASSGSDSAQIAPEKPSDFSPTRAGDAL